jgi:hypothetical protein
MFSLVLQILWHVALGFLLAGLVWGVGLGWLVIGRPGSALSPSHAHAYPIGLAAVFVAAFLLLANPWLGLLDVVILVVPLVALARQTTFLRELAWVVVRPVLLAAPAAVGVGLVVGLRMHGPTASVPARGGADFLFYAARAVSLEHSVLPARNLVVAGERQTLFESGASLVSAALSHVPGTDVFLFQTSTVLTLFVVSLAVGIALIARGPRATGTPVWLPVLALLSLAVTVDHLTESPPSALVLPIAFSLLALILEPTLPPFAFALLGALTAFDLALTKLVVLLAVGMAFAFASAQHGLRVALDWRRLAPLAAAGAVAVAAVISLAALGTWEPGIHLSTFSSQLWHIHGLESEGSWRANWPLLRALGELVLLALLMRARLWWAVAVFGAALLFTYVIDVVNVEIVTLVAVLMVITYLRTNLALLYRYRAPLFVAALLFFVSTWFRDTDELRASLLYETLFGAGVFGALIGTRGVDRRLANELYAASAAVVATVFILTLGAHALLAAVAGFLLPFWLYGLRVAAPKWRRWLAAATAVGVMLGAAQLAYAVRLQVFQIGTFSPGLTTADYGVWDAVERLTPRDALVFTDVYGGGFGGFYAALGHRQVYVGGLPYSVLDSHPQERANRQALNDRVVAGRTSPRSVPGARSYSSFYVVRLRMRPPATTFRLSYENEKYALYRIAA